MTVGSEEIYKKFASARDFADILEYFQELCDVLQVDRTDFRRVYRNIKSKVQTHDAKALWALIDKRAKLALYEKNKVCSGAKMVIIGAGPCGLRMAIEGALLGARVIVIEMRDYFARNNVLHLWPFVIHDLKTIGAKIFYPGFATGSINHISIRRLQSILLKVALLLGVEIHTPVAFKGLTEPEVQEDGTVHGWRLELSPEVPSLKELDIDIVVGADGKRNTLTGFHRKLFRGKQAIAITCNFVNLRTHADNQVTEIGGIFYVFRREFFDNLTEKSGIQLENFVYYRGDTHYFVMTARKKSLLQKGVLREDSSETGHLLRRENIDQEKLKEFAVEAATIATENRIPMMQFCSNHHEEDDVAIFDFTQMTQATHSSLVVERENKRLLKCIVGDSLIEPFWPTGSGCARGFLSVFDAAWLMRSWCPGKRAPLEVLGEREALLKTLSQSTPNTLKSKLDKYTIDPTTRYNYVPPTLKPEAVRHLWDRSDIIDEHDDYDPPPAPMRRFTEAEALLGRRRGRSNSLDCVLLSWYQARLTNYKDTVNVWDMLNSWRDGRALCALMHAYRPESIDMEDVVNDDALINIDRAFEIAEREWGISPLISPEDLALSEHPDALSLLTYLHQLKDVLSTEPNPDGQIECESDSDDDGYEGLASDLPTPPPRYSNASSTDIFVIPYGMHTDLTETTEMSKDHESITLPTPINLEQTSSSSEPENCECDEVEGTVSITKVESVRSDEEKDRVEEEVSNRDFIKTGSYCKVNSFKKTMVKKYQEWKRNAKLKKTDDHGFAHPIKPRSMLMVPIPEGMDVDDFTADFHNYGMASLDVPARHGRGRRPSAISLLTGMSEMIGSRKRHAEPTVVPTAKVVEEVEAVTDADSMDACSGIAAKRIMALQSKFATTDSPPKEQYRPPSIKRKSWGIEKDDQTKENKAVPIPINRMEISEAKPDSVDVLDVLMRQNTNNNDDGLHSSPERKDRLKRISDMFDNKSKPLYLQNDENADHKDKDTENGSVQEKPSVTGKKLAPWASVPGRGQTSQVCCICGEITYILERQSKDGYFFHRQCCNCATCHCTLRVGAMYIHEQRGKVKFLCIKHAQDSGYFQPRRRMSLAAIAAKKRVSQKFDLEDNATATPSKPISNGVPLPGMNVHRLEDVSPENKGEDVHSTGRRVRFDAPSHPSHRATTIEDKLRYLKAIEEASDSDSGNSQNGSPEQVSVISHFKPSAERHVSFTNMTISTPGSTAADNTQRGDATPTTASSQEIGEAEPAGISSYLPNVQQSNDQNHASSEHMAEDSNHGNSETEFVNQPSSVSYMEQIDDSPFASHVPFDLTPHLDLRDRDGFQNRDTTDEDMTSNIDDVATTMEDLTMNGHRDQTSIDGEAKDAVTESDTTNSPGFASESQTPSSSDVETEEEEEETATEEDDIIKEKAQEETPSHYDRKDSDITGEISSAWPNSAVGDDNTGKDDGHVVLRRKSRSAEGKRDRPSTVYRHSTSIRLLMAHEIQTGLEDVDQQGEALEERGRHVEQVLRGVAEEEDQTQEELLDEWMEVLQQKQQLRNQELRLLLKKKLLDLQEQKKQLQKALVDAEDEGQEAILDEMKQLSEDYTNVRNELAELTAQMRESKAGVAPWTSLGLSEGSTALV